MADIVICYSGDGERVAGRLAGGLAAAGFTIWTEERSSGAVTDRVDEVQAAIVVWSERARSSDWIRAEANYARGQKKLVQVSADGLPPPMPFDPHTSHSFAHWSGEPDHSGWQQVKQEIEAMVRSSRAATASAPSPTAPSRRAPPPRQKRRGGSAVMLVLIALMAAVAAVVWTRSGPPFGREPAPVALPKSVTEPTIPELPPLLPPPLSSDSEAVPAPALGNESQAGPPIGSENETAPADEESPAPRERPPRKAEPTETRRAPQSSGPRISRRNSRNMRLFCQRAGRGTPQCRTFQRRLRNQQR